MIKNVFVLLNYYFDILVNRQKFHLLVFFVWDSIFNFNHQKLYYDFSEWFLRRLTENDTYYILRKKKTWKNSILALCKNKSSQIWYL